MNKDPELEQMESDLEDLIEQVKRKRLDLIFDATGLQESEICIGSWACSNSPIGRCVYDMVEDPDCDFCVFCNGSLERK